MSKDRNRIVIWCNDGANQKALACKIAAAFNVVGIVREKRKKERPKILQVINKLIDRSFFHMIGLAWRNLQRYYDAHFPQWPSVKTLDIAYINSDEVIDFTGELHPDIIVVSGTSLIRKKLLTLNPSVGIINLHTGLSPYVKGGPNCTNWCIANNEWGLIGNTIMWINSGIDSGNIITTKKTDVSDCNSFFEIHKKVMEEAHQLYLDAIRYLVTASAPYISVQQKEIAPGKLYLTKMWTNRKKWQLIRNLKRMKKYKLTSTADIRTVDLPLK
jgi:folate-dependent phosphoribosylglycinamide formyltransferase PurN